MALLIFQEWITTESSIESDIAQTKSETGTTIIITKSKQCRDPFRRASLLVRAVGRTYPPYVDQGDFDGEGRQGRKHVVVELEFDT